MDTLPIEKPEVLRRFDHRDYDYVDALNEEFEVVLSCIYCDRFEENYTGNERVAFYINSEGVVSLTKPNGNYVAIISDLEFVEYNEGLHLSGDGLIFTEQFVQLDTNKRLMRTPFVNISRKLIQVNQGSVLIGVRKGITMYDTAVSLAYNIGSETITPDMLNDTTDIYLKEAYLYSNSYDDIYYKHSIDLHNHMNDIKTGQRYFEYLESQLYYLPRENEFTEYLKSPKIMIPFINPDNKQAVLFINRKLHHIRPHVIRRGTQWFILLNLTDIYDFPAYRFRNQWLAFKTWYNENKVENLFTVVLRDSFKYYETSMTYFNNNYIIPPIKWWNSTNREIYADGLLLEDNDWVEDSYEGFRAIYFNMYMKEFNGSHVVLTYGNKYKRSRITKQDIITLRNSDFYFTEMYLDGKILSRRDIIKLSSKRQAILLKHQSGNDKLTIFEYRELDEALYTSEGNVTSLVDSVYYENYIQEHGDTVVGKNTWMYMSSKALELYRLLTTKFETVTNSIPLDAYAFEKGYLNYDELKNKYPSLFNAEGDLVLNCNVLLPKGVMLPLNPIKPYMSTEYMIKLGFLYSLYNIHTLEELILYDKTLDNCSIDYMKQFERLMFRNNWLYTFDTGDTISYGKESDLIAQLPVFTTNKQQFEYVEKPAVELSKSATIFNGEDPPPLFPYIFNPALTKLSPTALTELGIPEQEIIDIVTNYSNFFMSFDAGYILNVLSDNLSLVQKAPVAPYALSMCSDNAYIYAVHGANTLVKYKISDLSVVASGTLLEGVQSSGIYHNDGKLYVTNGSLSNKIVSIYDAKTLVNIGVIPHLGNTIVTTNLVFDDVHVYLGIQTNASSDSRLRKYNKITGTLVATSIYNPFVDVATYKSFGTITIDNVYVYGCVGNNNTVVKFDKIDLSVEATTIVPPNTPIKLNGGFRDNTKYLFYLVNGLNLIYIIDKTTLQSYPVVISKIASKLMVFGDTLITVSSAANATNVYADKYKIIETDGVPNLQTVTSAQLGINTDAFNGFTY